MTATIDEGYRLLACAYLSKQAKQLDRQLRGIPTDNDVEYVHQARVASRRLRAALSMFADCFSRKKVRRWRKRIHQITVALGCARDKDVQIAFLERVLGAVDDPCCYPGLARLLVHLQRKREQAQPAIVAAAQRMRACGVLRQMRRLGKRLGDQSTFSQQVRSSAAVAQTTHHMLQRLEEFLQDEESLQDPDDQQRHHAMRIAAKRFRYTMEISRPVHGEALDEHIAAVKRVQTVLGEIHDCDVWVADLDRFAARERKRIEKLYGFEGPFARLNFGFQYLREDRLQRRRQLFTELGDFWQELSQKQSFQQLAEKLIHSGQTDLIPPEGTALTASAEPSTAAGSSPELRVDHPPEQHRRARALRGTTDAAR